VFVERHAPDTVPDQWPIAPVQRRKTTLTSAWPTTACRIAKAPPDLLQRFCRLDGQSDKAIARFAQTFGLLNLCRKHELPADHHRDCERRFFHPPSGPREPIRVWRRWVRRLLGTIGMVQHHAVGVALRADDVEASFLGFDQWAGYVSILRPPLPITGYSLGKNSEAIPEKSAPWRPPSSLVQGHILARWLNFLLDTASGGVSVRVSDERRFELVERVNPRCPLFSRLIREVAGVAAHGCIPVRRCKGCSQLFLPHRRSVLYCGACGSSKRTSLATQRLRAKRQAQGLTARGGRRSGVVSDSG
jgi:hypothetical protein